jgi:hypothetical protein
MAATGNVGVADLSLFGADERPAGRVHTHCRGIMVNSYMSANGGKIIATSMSAVCDNADSKLTASSTKKAVEFNVEQAFVAAKR